MRCEQSQCRRSASLSHVHSFYLIHLVLMENGKRKRQMNLSFKRYLNFLGGILGGLFGCLGLTSLFLEKKKKPQIMLSALCEVFLTVIWVYMIFSLFFNYHFCTVYGQNNGNTCFISVNSFLGGHVQNIITPQSSLLEREWKKIQMCGAPCLT